MNAGNVVGYAQDRPYSWVVPAVLTLRRERCALTELSKECCGPLLQWTRSLGRRIQAGECERAVLFCEDPALVVCVLNKLPGLRAAAVTTVPQAGRATLTLAANVLVVEMPGRTFYEVRQMLWELCATRLPCPEALAETLKELDGHAHR